MFTRCPQCARVFAITAQQLRCAQGDVRCGNCATIFNAVESLTDEAPSPPDPPITPAGAPAASSAADGYSRAAEGETTAAPDSDDGSLEFDAPEQTWSNFFIEDRPAARAGEVALDRDEDAIGADPNEWQALLAEIEAPRPWQGAEAGSGSGEDGDAAERLAQQLTAADGDDQAEAAGDADQAPEWFGETGIEPGTILWVDEDLSDAQGAREAADTPPAAAATAQQRAGRSAETHSDGGDEIALDDLPAAWADAPPVARRQRRAPWLLACLLLALLAAGQWLHMQRDALAADPRWGVHVRALYAALGRPLFPEWPLAAYTVRRAEAIAGSSARDALDIDAVVEISGTQPVGLPLISVTLRDQWGNPVGRGIFRPEDYLPAALAPIVPPGTRIPVEISVVDPGSQARGYVVDVCLPSRRAGLRCKQGLNPFTR